MATVFRRSCGASIASRKVEPRRKTDDVTQGQDKGGGRRYRKCVNPLIIRRPRSRWGRVRLGTSGPLGASLSIPASMCLNMVLCGAIRCRGTAWCAGSPLGPRQRRSTQGPGRCWPTARDSLLDRFTLRRTARRVGPGGDGAPAPRSSARRPLEGAGVGVGDQLGGRVRAGVGQLTGDRALHQARHGAHRRLPVTREIQS
jgi:hypothetical protein